MGAASPGDAHLAGNLALLAAVVLPAASLSQMTELLVSCVLACFTKFDLILTWPCCETAMCSFDLYHSGFKEHMLHLAIYSMMQW
jgi:hypothetical protein